MAWVTVAELTAAHPTSASEDRVGDAIEEAAGLIEDYLDRPATADPLGFRDLVTLRNVNRQLAVDLLARPTWGTPDYPVEGAPVPVDPLTPYRARLARLKQQWGTA